MEIKVLAIIPAYNEEKTIASVINELKTHKFIDILVINDGSRDSTSKIAHSLCVEVIDSIENQGIGSAMKKGYQFANNNGYDIAIQVDADGQHDISKINELILVIKENNFDMVIGSRYIEKTQYVPSIFRHLGAKYFSFFIFLLHKKTIKDTTSGYRVVNKLLINYFAEYYPSYYPEVPMLSRLIDLKYKICEIPVEMKKRQGGKSSISFWDSFYYVIKITYICIREKIRHKRLREKTDEYRIKNITEIKDDN